METGDKEAPVLVGPDDEKTLKKKEKAFNVLEEEFGKLLERAGKPVTREQVKIEEEELLKQTEEEIVIPKGMRRVGVMLFELARFKTVKLTDAVQATLVMMIPPEEWENLSQTELSKLHKRATKGLKTKFRLLPINFKEV